MIRIYYSNAIATQNTIALDKNNSHYLSKVLRMKAGDELIVFNGDGHDYLAQVKEIHKHATLISILEKQNINRESDLHIHLAQGISKGSKMDFTIQKAVELGVTEITPLFTERCDVKLSHERQDKKMAHWQEVIIAACMQCGRNVLPKLNPPFDYDAFLNMNTNATGIILAPTAKQSLKDIKIKKDIVLLIGPEGGLSEQEIKQAESHQYTPIRLGPRILRTETAGLAILSALQTLSGDFG